MCPAIVGCALRKHKTEWKFIVNEYYKNLENGTIIFHGTAYILLQEVRLLEMVDIWLMIT